MAQSYELWRTNFPWNVYSTTWRPISHRAHKNIIRFSSITVIKGRYGIESIYHANTQPWYSKIFTILHIDLNYLVTCKAKKRNTCHFCHINGESVKHFLMVCTHFDKLHIKFEISIRNVPFSYDNLSLNSKLKYIIDLCCPLKAVSSCLNLYRIYISREKDCDSAKTDILLCSIFLIYSHYCNHLFLCDCVLHDDVIKWKHFLRYWPFLQGNPGHRWISRTKASDAELWCFLWSVPE